MPLVTLGNSLLASLSVGIHIASKVRLDLEDIMTNMPDKKYYSKRYSSILENSCVRSVQSTNATHVILGMLRLAIRASPMIVLQKVELLPTVYRQGYVFSGLVELK